MDSIGNTPKILYKYRDWDNDFHKNILYKQEIFLPSASKFNDPFEGNIPFEYDQSELSPANVFIKMLAMAKEDYPNWSDSKLHEYVYEYQKKGLLFDPLHLEKNKVDVKVSIEKTFGILCLTVNSNNFLMWSHYSNSHSGFCIGFDTEILYNTFECAIGPVDYEDLIPKFKLFEPIDVFVKKLLGTKGKIWAYEKEYRIIKSKGANKLFTIPNDCIVEIVLGCKMNFATKMSIVEHIKRTNAKCVINEIRQSEIKFELIKDRIY